MKKTLVVITSLLVVTGVFASSSLAHGGKHGRHHSRHANVWTATLLPPGATGSTGATEEVPYTRRHGKASYAGATGPVGKVVFVKNRSRYVVGVRLRNLTPATTYNVAIYTNSDGQGCSSTTNTALNPTAIPAITTNSTGFGRSLAKGPTSELALDKTASYYVSVTDASGANVLCGDLAAKWKKRHKRGCHGHGSTGTTGATGTETTRSGWHH